jgi:hypothetical protein
MNYFATPKLKNSIYVLFAIMFFNSCQKEEIIIIDKPTEDQRINANSPLTNLMSRMTQNPTSKDNILDKSSCVSVKLPVSVTINNQTFVANSYDQVLDFVANITNPTPQNTAVQMIFPLRVVKRDYSTVDLSSQTQMNNATNNCDDNNGLSEIDCVKINFPISVTSYNTDNQVATAFNISSNEQLFNFLNKELKPQLISKINYPITVTNVSNQTIVINSNQDFENFILNSITVCSNTSPTNEQNFLSVLQSTNWKISSYIENGISSQTFSGYVFTFDSSGSSSVFKDGILAFGNWDTDFSNSDKKLILNYPNAILNLLNEDWKIIEYTGTIIKLKNISGGNGGTDYLTFIKN